MFFAGFGGLHAQWRKFGLGMRLTHELLELLFLEEEFGVKFLGLDLLLGELDGLARVVPLVEPVKVLDPHLRVMVYDGNSQELLQAFHEDILLLKLIQLGLGWRV
jgi:hypothetical protein